MSSSDGTVPAKTASSETEQIQNGEAVDQLEATTPVAPQTYWCHECQKNVDIPASESLAEPACPDCNGCFIELIQANSVYSDSDTEQNIIAPSEYLSARALARLGSSLSSQPVTSAAPTELPSSSSTAVPNTPVSTNDREANRARLTQGLASSISTLFSTITSSLDANTAERLSLDLSAPVSVVIHTAVAPPNFPLSSLWNSLGNYSTNNANDTEAFNNLLHQLFMQSQAQGNPPASKAFITSLKANKVKPEQLHEDCAVCKETWLEDNTTGSDKLVCELGCGHKFCEECIVPWLEKRNTCPVCRFEVPTDDKEYEQDKLRTRQNNSQVSGTQID